MFASTDDARALRKRLKRHISPHGSSKCRATKYLREGGPFAAFPGSRGGALGDVVIDPDHRLTVDAASRNLLLAGPLRIISQAAAGAIQVMRGDESVELRPAFESFVNDMFQRIAGEVMRSVLVYGIVVVALVDNNPSVGRGILPLQRTGAASLKQTPVVLDLASDKVHLSFSDDGGCRAFHVEVEGLDLDPSRFVLSVVDAPSATGMLQSITAGLVGAVLEIEHHFALCLDVAVEQSNPVTLLQERHGPSRDAAGSSAVPSSSLFFDSESLESVSKRREEHQKDLLEQVKTLNAWQTRNITPVKNRVTGEAREVEPPRLHVIMEGLETATHAVTAQRASIVELVALRKSVAEDITSAFGIPAGLLRHGDGTKTSSSHAQQRFFDQRVARLRSHTQSVLTELWHRMRLHGSEADEISIIDAESSCHDLDRLESLHAAGLLETTTARQLVANALNLKHCLGNNRVEKTLDEDKDDETKGIEEDDAAAASAPGSVTG